MAATHRGALLKGTPWIDPDGSSAAPSAQDFAGQGALGDLLVDGTNGVLYVNRGTPAAPDWSSDLTIADLDLTGTVGVDGTLICGEDGLFTDEPADTALRLQVTGGMACSRLDADGVFEFRGTPGTGFEFTTTDGASVLFRMLASINRSIAPFGIGATGAQISALLTGTTAFDPSSLADGETVSSSVTVTGAALGDHVLVSFSGTGGIPAGAVLTGSVTSANTVTATVINHTGVPLDLPAGTLRATVLRVP